MLTEVKIPSPEQQSTLLYHDILENPFIRSVGSWHCRNSADPIDEEAYVEKAKADIGAFSNKLDDALKLL